MDKETFQILVSKIYKENEEKKEEETKKNLCSKQEVLENYEIFTMPFHVSGTHIILF
jgi:hypothetical protein